MPRKPPGLTALAVKSAKPGRYGDGGGLYLLVRDQGARYWLFRYRVAGKMREMGLGRAGSERGAVSLANARDDAFRLKEIVKKGGDPLAERDADRKAATVVAQDAISRAKTFRIVAEAYLDAHEAAWRHPKHRLQWRTSLETYAEPHMGSLAVGEVAIGHVLAVLQPIWRVKPETASRVRSRIESVLDYASAQGWRTGDNPARWRGHLSKLLPARARMAPVKHYSALPWREIAAFLDTMRTYDGVAVRALEFAILTAARTGEVLGACWAEIDTTNNLWTVPAERMKAGREHRVPLSGAAIKILRAMMPLRLTSDESGSGFVFPGGRAERPLSSMAMLMALRRMGRGDLTAHGFRSCFRDWVSEQTDYAGEVAEMALAHSVPDKVEAAYRRGDLFEKRRSLMEDWARFCGGVVIKASTVNASPNHDAASDRSV